jgi:myo-inositol-1(or 4)-monophosphatase
VIVEAGQRALDLSANIRSWNTKSSSTDLVTNADLEVECLIVQRILATSPDDSIEAEEGSGRTGTSNVRWWVDPIDGTTEFFYGRPLWSVSIAVEVDGAVVAGAVYAPLLGQLFTASLGGGAKCNGEPISIGRVKDLEFALIGTGFSYNADIRRRQAETLCEVAPKVRDFRRSGSAALELCMVAAGKSDGFFEDGLTKWDTAAGFLIVEEAGGVAGVLDIERGVSCAANPALFTSLTRLLRAQTAQRDVHR